MSEQPRASRSGRPGDDARRLDSLDEAVRPLLAPEPPDPDSDDLHMTTEQAADWLAGALPEEHVRAVADHLETCPACTDMVLGMEALQAEEPADEDVADLELEAAWRSFNSYREQKTEDPADTSDQERRELAPPSGISEANPSTPSAVDSATPERAPPRPHWWVAAALCALSLGLGWQLAKLSPSLDPESNVPVAYLESVRSEVAFQVELSPENRTLLLILSPSEPEAFSSYSVIVRRVEGTWRRQVSSLSVSDHESIRFSLPATELAAGSYQILLRGGPQETPIATFTLEVERP